MSNIPHLLVHDHEDNLGVVVVEGLTAGAEMFSCVTHHNSTFTLTAGAPAVSVKVELWWVTQLNISAPAVKPSTTTTPRLSS